MTESYPVRTGLASGHRRITALRASCALRRAIHDHRHRAAAVGSLMLGAAGHEDLRVADEAAERAGHERAGVAGRGDIGIVQHGVAMAAQAALAARFRLA